MATPFDTIAHRQPIGVTTNAVVNPITPGQVSYLTDLITRKGQLLGKSDAEMAAIGPWVNGLSKTAASDAITATKAWLLENGGDQSKAFVSRYVDHMMVAAEAGMPSAEVVPAGRYAVDTDDGAVNATAFYKVDRPTEGRWAGRVFVKLITGDDEQRLSWTTTKTVLAKIAAAGAAEASARYGHEIGRCGVCDRQLTNDESRAAGIGPVCRAKMAW